MQFVNKHVSKFSANSPPRSLTKGEAANIITRLKHGAKARHHKKAKAAEKEAKAAEKEAKRRARERVEVGPLAE